MTRYSAKDDAMQALINGEVNLWTIIVWTVLAFPLALLGGALAGIKLAGKDLGIKLAAMVGALFGPVAAVPGVLLALLALALG
ncbi:MAG: hypothetical protein M0P19_02665 [Nevskia sp.]|jgi:hypothetical protein|nr:hypothetical protein [Nevskia sp.]MCK9383191.1 hypothetical protein [Nevskia sp.]